MLYLLSLNQISYGTHRKNLITTTSFITVLLLTSLFACVFANESSGASLADAVHVKNESELRNAINNATSKGTTIALNNDISLTDTLTIPANKEITLTSNKNAGYYKLNGTSGKSTITIENNGILKIDGIIVTHTKGDKGKGIFVGGQLIMYSGEISGNTAPAVISEWDTDPLGNPINWGSEGGGVYIYNKCVFEMYGGKISNNKAEDGLGGGVYNLGTFTMAGGEISGNTAANGGGGVFNWSTFEISGGTISGNKAYYGGGVYHNTRSGGTFEQFGGKISGNTATEGDNDIYVLSDKWPSGSNDDSSNGKDGTSNGNNGSSDGNNSGGTNKGNNEQNGGDFSVRDFVIICVGTAVVTIGIIIIVLLMSFQKRITQVEEKMNQSTNNS